MTSLTLTTRLGSGATSTVYRAVESPTGNIVAVKKSRASQRLKRPILQYEAAVIHHLAGHPALPQVFGYGHLPHFEYLSLELLHGCLASEKAPLASSVVSSVADQMLRALEHVHSHGVVHRDIKPSNIMRRTTDNSDDTFQFCLIDFGLARKAETTFDPPEPGPYSRVTGTLPYASLNAHSTSRLSYRDDVESLAYTLINLKVGSLPWSAFCGLDEPEFATVARPAVVCGVASEHGCFVLRAVAVGQHQSSSPHVLSQIVHDETDTIPCFSFRRPFRFYLLPDQAVVHSAISIPRQRAITLAKELTAPYDIWEQNQLLASSDADLRYDTRLRLSPAKVYASLSPISRAQLSWPDPDGRAWFDECVRVVRRFEIDNGKTNWTDTPFAEEIEEEGSMTDSYFEPNSVNWQTINGDRSLSQEIARGSMTSGAAKVKVIARLRPRLDTESADDDGIRVCHAEQANTSADSTATANASGSGSSSSMLSGGRGGLSFTGIAVNNPRDPSQVFRFPFTSAYGADATQESIFENDVKPLVDVALSGVTVTVFAYGVTSSGKTHTMQGNPANPGVIPRVVEALFDKSASNSANTDISVSYIEIYKDEVYDLLVPRESAPKLPVRENEAGMVFVAGLISQPIANVDAFKKLYSTATSRRSVGATRLNDQSSRSHAVLTLNLRTRDGSVIREGKVNLVDLAGSENNKQTGNDSSRMAESKAINTSLTALGMVVHALNTGQTRIPYRNSKLTRLLQDALGGSSVGLLICNLAPSAKFRQDTLNTLNFAVRTKNIENKPVVNERETRPPRIDFAQMGNTHSKTSHTGAGRARPESRHSLVPRPASRTSTFGIAGSRMSLVGAGAAGLASVAAAEKEKAPPGLSEAEIDARISKAVEAEVARRLEEREKELEKERERAREEWGRERELERERERKSASSSRAQSRSPNKEVRRGESSAPASAGSKRAREEDDELYGRLQELERKFEWASKGNEAALAEALSPVGKKKAGRAYVVLARTFQERGDLETALELYQRAEAYVPGNTKLRDRIIEIEWSVKNRKPFKPSPRKRKKAKVSAPSSPEKPKGRKTREAADTDGEMDVYEEVDEDQMDVDEVESALTGGGAVFGAEVTNTRVTRSASKAMGKGKTAKRTLLDADEEMDATPAKRAKRGRGGVVTETEGDDSDEENAFAAPKKRGRGRSLRSAAAAA
uniref:Kinesin-like protein n=1 Tax=Mycena chlorophos TaxID=658473 RepID=A0ABQ0M6F0_MYCCL|nr:kinesin-like protein [Mycena chlorophos]